MDERSVGPEQRSRSRWARRAVLLGAIGAGLWLASILNRGAVAEAAVPGPICCPVQSAATLPATIIHDSLDNPASSPASSAVIDTVRQLVRTLPVPAPVHAPNPTLPILTSTKPVATSPGLASRSARPIADQLSSRSTVRWFSATSGSPAAPARCSTCRPDQGTPRSAADPLRSPVLPIGDPSGGGNAGDSIATMALLAPANGHGADPRSLRAGLPGQAALPRSLAIAPTTRPG